MIVTVTPNPTVDHILFVDKLVLHDANRPSRVERDAGGKGINASRVISNLGGHTLATGFVGGGTGAFIRHAMVEEGVRHQFVSVQGENRLNFAIEDRSGLPPTSICEPGPRISERELEELLRFLAERIHPQDWVLVAGSLPPGVTTDLFARVGDVVRKRSARFALDADGANLKAGLRARPSFVKPNVEEAERLLGRSLPDQEAILEAAEEIRAMADADSIVVISRGRDGAIMAEPSGLWVGESPKIDVRSTVGSGDSMVGAMLHALSDGRAASEALALGMAAGAATASVQGSGLASREGVMSLLPSCKVRFVRPTRALATANG